MSLKKVPDLEVANGPLFRLKTSQGVVTCRDFLNCSWKDIKDGLAHFGSQKNEEEAGRKPNRYCLL